jgi:peptidoglycan/LPS O-acetylase OafA/YrhL
MVKKKQRIMRTIDPEVQTGISADKDIFGKISISRTEIMGLAAIWIYYFHVGRPLSCHAPLLGAAFWYLHRIGFIGVDIFLIISGYGLYHSMSRRPVTDLHTYADFLKRRFARLWKAYIPVTLLFAVKDRWPVGVLILRILGINQLIKGIYDYLWFIPCIYILYIFAPLIFKLVNKICATRLRYIFPAVICALVYIFCIVTVPYVRSDLYGLITRIPAFFTGMFFAQLSMKCETECEAKRAHAAAGIYIAAAAACLYRSYRLNGPTAQLSFEAENALINQLIAPGLVLVLAWMFTGLRKAAGNRHIRGAKAAACTADRILCAFGTISLEFYCLQERIWEGLRWKSMPYAVLQLLCLALTLILAAGIHMIMKKLEGCIGGRVNV